MGIKNQKGTVSAENYRNRVRLRWRYQGKRYSLNLGAYTKTNLSASKKIVLQIELDIANGNFDESLVRYGAKEEKVAPSKTIVECFEFWVSHYKQLDCNKNSDYYHLRNTLRKWGELAPKTLPLSLSTEKYCAKTYNERLSMLKAFSEWMLKQGVWSVNPFEGISRRRVKKIQKPERAPFTEEEIRQILDAIKDDRFCPPSSRYKHSFYYPFIYLLFKTGLRVISISKCLLVLKTGYVPTSAYLQMAS